MHLFKIILLSLVFVNSPALFAASPTSTATVETKSVEAEPTEAEPTVAEPTEIEPTEIEPTEIELERWFNSDDSNPPEFQQAKVNDGDLFFLNKKPLEAVHHHSNVLTIYQTSLKDGWIKVEQCHRHLDRVARLQVMFNKNTVRDIHITKAFAIEHAWVENNSVQLENINNNAVLCIQAWSKALVHKNDGSYGLSNGPFMRKFLDGYYPIHVTIDINFQATNLKLVHVEPMEQTGFKVTQAAKTVNIDTWFEGRLKTKLTFTN